MLFCLEISSAKKKISLLTFNYESEFSTKISHGWPCPSPFVCLKLLMSRALPRPTFLSVLLSYKFPPEETIKLTLQCLRDFLA